MKDSDLLEFSADLGAIMLASGAETYRVEDTMERVLSFNGERHPETFVTTTGIFICIKNYQDDPFTVIRRIRQRGTNLEKIIAANALSRDFTSGKITLKEAIARLEEIKKIKSFKPWLVVVADGIISGGFALMLGSGIIDALSATVIGMILGIVLFFFKRSRSEAIFEGFLGGFVVAALAVIFKRIGFGNDVNGIIVGAIMPLVPGVATTTAIRDLMEGDYLSGVSRMMEAILTAIAIASGAGVALSVLGGVGI